MGGPACQHTSSAVWIGVWSCNIRLSTTFTLDSRLHSLYNSTCTYTQHIHTHTHNTYTHTCTHTNNTHTHIHTHTHTLHMHTSSHIVHMHTNTYTLNTPHNTNTHIPHTPHTIPCANNRDFHSIEQTLNDMRSLNEPWLHQCFLYVIMCDFVCHSANNAHF